MRIQKLAASLGAEVTDLDLRNPIDDALADTLRCALYAHQVLLFRSQQLGLTDQLRFTGVLGQVDTPWDQNHLHPDEPRIQLITNAGRQGINYKTSTLYWHTDQSFAPKPSRETVLCAVAVPPTGGNTLFANMRQAYEDLPEDLRARLRTLRARHSFGYLMMPIMRQRVSDAAATRDVARFPDVEHPLVRTHPVTGQQSLYLNELCVDRIVNLDEAASSELLQQLFAHCLRPRYIYAHQWVPGDVVVWDNVSTMHRADDIPADHPRLFNRSNTIGQEPF